MATKKYLDYAGLKRVLAKLLPGARKIWHGTLAEWEALSATEKAKYDQAEVIDEYTGVPVVVDKVESGNLNPVTSNAVAKAMAKPIRRGTIQTGVITAHYSTTKTVTFSEPMPDTNYVVTFDQGTSSWADYLVTVTSKTVNGFVFMIVNTFSNDSVDVTYNYQAFKL